MRHYIEIAPEHLPGPSHQLQVVEHIKTEVVSCAPGQSSGSTDWKVLLQPGWVELSWDWKEVLAGIVVMSNPTGIASNMRIVDGGQEITDFQVCCLKMNLLVHAIDWQPTVCAELRRRNAGRREAWGIH